jgi:hypothetical protein
MAKLLLLSIILSTIALPARAARIKEPRLGLKRAMTWLAAFNLIYFLMLRFVWHRLY